MQNESFSLARPKQAHPERIPNTSRRKTISSQEKKCFLPREKLFPPERTKTLSLVLYLIIYERVKNVAHLKKDA